jgi:hypothetical protein
VAQTVDVEQGQEQSLELLRLRGKLVSYLLTGDGVEFGAFPEREGEAENRGQRRA